MRTRVERAQMAANTRDRLLLGLGATALVLVAGTVGVVIYAAHRASPTALRWWAVGVTLALPVVAVIAYAVGRTEARGHVAGLTQGVEAVSGAAQRVVEAAGHVADVRVATAQRLRQRPVAAAPFNQFIIPGTALPGMGGPAGLIMPPAQPAEEDVEL